MTVTNTTIQTAIRVLAQGFFDDPMLSFLFPDPDSRMEALTHWFQVFAQDGYQRGTVTLEPTGQGAIIWYPAEIEVFDDGFNDLLSHAAAIVAQFSGADGLNRFEQLGEIVMGSAPDTPHYEVFWLALHPDARGQGLGGLLLQSALDQADATQTGCHLVSSNPRNVSFYERYGFHRRRSLQVGDTLPLTSLWREPQLSTPN
jgi:ribosomal protein S18 acetylase RimI-like enzyme